MATETITKRVWSKYQEDVFVFVENETGSLIVEAVAGAGKTSTLVECARRLDSFSDALSVAFNKRVQEELERRLPAHVPCLTFNALGNRAWQAFTGKRQEIDKFKVTKLVRELADSFDPEYRSTVVRLVALAKAHGIVPTAVNDVRVHGLEPDTDETWEGLIHEHGLGFAGGADAGRGIALARRVLAESVRVGGDRIDFNDQLYLPVVFGVEFPRYETLFVDEAQDVSAIQFEMIERSIATKGRLIAFADKNQALYLFRGAGADSVDKLRERFNAISLPLSICYRCPRKVIERAKEYVPEIECAEGAEEGIVETGGFDMATLTPSDAILCRNNAPLVGLAFKLLRAGKPCKVLGRDIGVGLAALVKRMRATTNIELAIRLDKHLTEQARELDPDQLASLQDRVDTVKVFMENCGTPEGVLARIEGMFAEEGGAYVLLSTIHKYKGQEADRVFLLNFHLIGQRAKTEKDRRSERNIAYVGITRARKELRFVTI